jgi:hypothetical protein
VRTIVIVLCTLGSQDAFAQNVDPADIPQASVAAVLESLRADPSAQFGEQRGWTIVASNEDGSPVQWFFTPEGHPAHPAVVKRTALERDGVGMIDLAALCQAEQAACDQLLVDFRQRHELEQAAARPERVTLDVTIALNNHERLRVERLLAEEGMAAEIRFTDVLKVVIVPTLGDDGRVLLDGRVRVRRRGLRRSASRSSRAPAPAQVTLEMASTSGNRFGFSLASLVAHTAE